jgi:hypothetical protein
MHTIHGHFINGSSAKLFPHMGKSVKLFDSSSIYGLLGHAPTGTGTIALDPTFESFTLLEPISH